MQSEPRLHLVESEATELKPVLSLSLPLRHNSGLELSFQRLFSLVASILNGGGVMTHQRPHFVFQETD